jgi:twitching motility two-component system response regulator PilH
MAKVLAVDDSLTDLRFIQSALADHQVLLVSKTEGLEELIESTKPDLLLLDIVMPGRSGFELLRSLRRRETTRNLPVLVISSKGAPTDIEWGKRQGANGYLVKPFTAEALQRAVKELV